MFFHSWQDIYIYIYIYIQADINRKIGRYPRLVEDCEILSENKVVIFFRTFFMKVKIAFFGIALLQNFFSFCRNICFEVIQDSDRSNRVIRTYRCLMKFSCL